jgi:hypothetical protein
VETAAHPMFAQGDVSHHRDIINWNFPVDREGLFGTEPVPPISALDYNISTIMTVSIIVVS